MIDQGCIMLVRGLERQLITPHALISAMQTYRARKEIEVIEPSIVFSVEPRRLRHMLILTMLVEIQSRVLPYRNRSADW